MVEEFFKLIDDAKKCIELDKSDPERYAKIRIAMNNVYRYCKQNIYEYRSKLELSCEMTKEIVGLELLMKDEFIPQIDSDPIFVLDEKIKYPVGINDDNDAEQAVKYIVYETRRQLNEHNNVNTDSLKGKCYESSNICKKICLKKSLECEDFACSQDLSFGYFHCFSIVHIPLKNEKSKAYIVDCTYRQFFRLGYCFLESIGILGKNGCAMGTYMIMDESRKKTAEHILKYGYIEATPENIKNYLSGFIFQGRNAYYYERLRKEKMTVYDFDVRYSADYLLNHARKNQSIIGIGGERQWYFARNGIGIRVSMKNAGIIFDDFGLDDSIEKDRISEVNESSKRIKILQRFFSKIEDKLKNK